MTISLKFFADPGLTIPLTELISDQASDGSSDDLSHVVYLGSVATGKVFRDAIAPGTAHIKVSVVDASPGAGNGVDTVQLALTAEGLGNAPLGAELDLGVAQIASGSAGAKAVYVRLQPVPGTPGVYSELALKVSGVIEVTV